MGLSTNAHHEHWHIDRDHSSECSRRHVDDPIPENRFESALRDLLNSWSMENASNTPDFVLAQYLVSCLDAFNYAVRYRESVSQIREIGSDSLFGFVVRDIEDLAETFPARDESPYIRGVSNGLRLAVKIVTRNLTKLQTPKGPTVP